MISLRCVPSWQPQWSYQRFSVRCRHHASHFCILHTLSIYSVQTRHNWMLHLPNQTSFPFVLRVSRSRKDLFGSDREARLPRRGSHSEDLCGEMPRGQHRGCDESLSVWPRLARGGRGLEARACRCCRTALRRPSVWKQGVYHQSTSDWLWGQSDGRWGSPLSKHKVSFYCVKRKRMWECFVEHGGSMLPPSGFIVMKLLCVVHPELCAVQQPAAVLASSNISWRRAERKGSCCSSPVWIWKVHSHTEI